MLQKDSKQGNHLMTALYILIGVPNPAYVYGKMLSTRWYSTLAHKTTTRYVYRSPNQLILIDIRKVSMQ